MQKTGSGEADVGAHRLNSIAGLGWSRKSALSLKFLLDHLTRLWHRAPRLWQRTHREIARWIGIGAARELDVDEIEDGTSRLGLLISPSLSEALILTPPALREALRALRFALKGGDGRPVHRHDQAPSSLWREIIETIRTVQRSGGLSWRDLWYARSFALAWLPKRGYVQPSDLGPHLATLQYWLGASGPIERRFFHSPEDVARGPAAEIRLRLTPAVSDESVALLLSEAELRVRAELRGTRPRIWRSEVATRSREYERLCALGFHESCRFLRAERVLLECTAETFEAQIRLSRSLHERHTPARWLTETAHPSLPSRLLHEQGPKSSQSENDAG